MSDNAPTVGGDVSPLPSDAHAITEAQFTEGLEAVAGADEDVQAAFRSYDQLGRLLSRKLASYVLLAARKREGRTAVALRASNRIAIERGAHFKGFEKSKYASGEFFDKYTEQPWEPKTDKVRQLFADADIRIPTQEDWVRLKESVQAHGIYNQNLQAVPPTGSISYINHSTSSIHPIASKVEIRKEGKIGRVYYPAPYMTNENLEYYEDAYEIGYEKIIDTYAAATQHVDQGLSLTLFFKDTATTRDVNKAQIYAWRKGIKTLYYIRLRQMALEGTEVEGCVSCML